MSSRSRAKEPPAAPRFSVVTPAYNTNAYVATAIRSVQLQTWPDFEVIVVDDGSTDDTASQVLAFSDDPRVRLIRQGNAGPSAARNTAIAAARGEYVCMLDSDDLWVPRYLEVMGAALDADPEAGFAYTDAWVLDEATGRVRRTSMMHYQRPPAAPPTDAGAFLRLLLDRNFVYTSVTVRKRVLEDVGGFDERLWAAEDWELWLRIAAAGHRALRPEGLLAIHRLRRGSLSADLLSMIDGVCEMYRIIEEEWETTHDVREVASAERALWQRQLDLRRSPHVRASPSERALQAARAVKRAIRGRRLWLSYTPPEIRATLAAVGVEPTR